VNLDGRLARVLVLAIVALLFGLFWLGDDAAAPREDPAEVVTAALRADRAPVDLPEPSMPAPTPILSAHPDAGGRAPPVLGGTVLDGGVAMDVGSVLVREARVPTGATPTWRRNASIESGAYRMKLPHAGRYTVVAYSQDAQRLSGVELVEAGWGEEVRLDLAVGATRITGRVLEESTGLPVAGARVSLQVAGKPVGHPTLMAEDVDENAHFALDGIGVGEYVVSAWDPNHLSRSSEEFAVIAPGSHDLGTLYLPRTPVLHAHASDPEGAARTGRIVIHLIDEARTEVLHTFSVMGAGSWHIRLIEPGRYAVMALAGGEADPEAWMPGAYDLVDVELIEGERTDVMLTIRQPANTDD